MHGKELVVGVGLYQVSRRSQQLQADQEGEKAANKEEERNRDQIEQRDPLVVRGEQPRPDAVVLVQIVLVFSRNCRSSHGYCTFGSCGCSPGGRELATPAVRAGGWLSDLMYATSAFNCSSLTKPWKTGIMGLNPRTTFAPGLKMDSRM